MNDILRQILVAVSVAATIVINILANALPLNGLNTGEISDRFDGYFTPAGYVFSIWGLIYLGLIAYTIYQALPSQRQNPRLRQTGYWVIGSGLANIVWLFLWHYEQFPLTLLAMFALFGTLAAVYLGLGTGRTQVQSAETWAVRLPFSIYLGWVTVATIANITAVLYFINWDGFGISPEIWMLVVLAAVLAISALVSLTRRDIAYVLVIVWALVGIAVKHSSVTSVLAGSLTVAALAVALLALGLNVQQTEKLIEGG